MAEPGSESESIQRLPRRRHRRANGHQRCQAGLRAACTVRLLSGVGRGCVCRRRQRRADPQVQKRTGPRKRGPARGFWFEAGLAVSASRLSATATTRATSATTTATALLSAGACTCGTVASLRCGGASGRGHGLFAFLYLVGILLVIDLEAFRFVVILIEVGSALEGDGRLGGRTLALGTRCAL